MDVLNAYIAEQLQHLDIDDESISEYIASIMLEDTIENDEKIEAISEFLTEATESSKVDDFLGKVQHRLAILLAAKDAEANARLLAKQLETTRLEQEVLMRDAIEASARPASGKKLSREDQRQRDALLAQYEYEYEDQVTIELENGELQTIYTGDLENDTSIERNCNVELVREKEAAKRKDAQEASQKQSARNKELQLSQARKKDEDEKRRKTQKQERKR